MRQRLPTLKVIAPQESDLGALIEPIRRIAMALGFSETLTLLKEFTDGISPTRVVLAQASSPGNFHPYHYVFKVGSSALLLQELENYRKLRESVGRNARFEAPFVPIENPDATRAVLEKHEQGALMYHHAAAAYGAPADTSLKSLFRECLQDRRPLQGCYEVLKLLVGAISTALYKNTERVHAHVIPTYYLEHWFPDYHIQIDTLTSQSDTLLLSSESPDLPRFSKRAALDASEPHELRQESEQQGSRAELLLRLPLFTDARLKNRTLRLNLPDQNLNLRIDTTNLAPGTDIHKLVSEAKELCIWSRKLQSRYAFYRERLAVILPDFNLDADHFILDPLSIKLPNPLRHLSRVFSKLETDSIKTHLAPAHGDLHPGNVLVVGNCPNFIDYGLSEAGLPVGVDLIRLMGSLIRDVVTQLLPFEQLQVVLWEIFTGGSTGLLSEQGQRARSVLSMLWGTICQSLKEEVELLPYHLYGYAWIGLKWNGNEHAHRACFLLAAMAAGMCHGEVKWERSRSWAVQVTELPGAQVPSTLEPNFVHPYRLQAHFTGREPERQQLNRWWREGREQLRGLIAMGGMGKSALAWVWLHADVLGSGLPGLPAPLEKPGSKPEGVLWWSFYEPGASFPAFLEAAAAYFVPHRKLDSPVDMAEELLRALQQRRILLIMDGLERELVATTWREASNQEELGAQPQEPSSHGRIRDPRLAEFLDKVANLPLKGRILFTSREFPRDLDGLAGVERYELKDLAEDDARRLFQAKSIFWAPGELRTIGQLCGYHPLSLGLLAGYILKRHRLATLSFNSQAFIEELRKAKRREHHILEIAYDALPARTQQLLSRMAAYRNPIRAESVSVISPFGPEEARILEEALAELIDRGLLFFDDQRLVFDMHPVVRSYAYDRLSNKREVHQHLREYFSHQEPPVRIRSLEDLESTIELYYHTVGSGDHGEAWKLFDARLNEVLRWKLNRSSKASELLEMLFVDGKTQSAWNSSGSSFYAALVLSMMYSDLGRSREVISLLSRWSEEKLVPSARGEWLKAMGFARHNLGELAEAESYYRHALKISTAHRHDWAVLRCVLFLGDLLVCIGQGDAAERCIEETENFIAVFNEDDKLTMAELRANIARYRGEFEKALELLRRAQQQAESMENEKWIVYLKERLAEFSLDCYMGGIWPEIFQLSGNDLLRDVETVLKNALERSRHVADDMRVNEISYQLARCHLIRRDLQAAEKHLTEALRFFGAREQRHWQAKCTLLLAHVAKGQGKSEEARQHAEEARKLALCQPPRYVYFEELRAAERFLSSLP